MNEPKPIYCPRCGKLAPILADHEEPGTVLNEDGELVPDYGIFSVPVRHILDWVQVGQFLVCPDCATLRESRAENGDCVRCGRENVEDEVWWEEGVCNSCVTRDEERNGVLSYLHRVAGAIAEIRASENFDRAAELADSWTTAVEIMRERGVTNHLHYAHPIDPLAGPDDEQPCWDVVSDELQSAVMRCSTHLCDVRYSAQERVWADGWHEADWWLIERTLRRYVREARESAQTTIAPGG